MSINIIIVGASSGIGRELACKYAALGHRVGITGRRENLLNQLAEEYPGQILVRCFDVTEEQNEEHINSLIEELGGLDLLIYNSGYGDPSLELKPEVEKLTTRTSVNGFISLVPYVFNYFVEQGYGQIAITSSVAAVRGNGWAPAYSASKAYLSIYAEGLNLKAGKLKKDIVITDIRPGFVDTRMSKGNGRFWQASVSKAVDQMMRAIEKKKRVAYVTKRWQFIARLMKMLPYAVYRRIV